MYTFLIALVKAVAPGLIESLAALLVTSLAAWLA